VHGGEIALANAVTAGDQPASLPRVLARVNLFGGVGDLTGPILIAAGRATGLSWRVLFVVAAVAVATYAVVLARTTFPPPVTERPDEDAEVPITRQARVWLLGLAALALMPLDESYLAIVLAHAERERGFSSAGAALLAIAFVAGSIAANTVLVPWVERSGAARVLGVSGASISALMLLTAVAPGWALIPIGLAFSGLIGMTWLAVTATALVANPGREGRTKLVVELMEFASLGVVLLLGIVADRAGLSTALLAYAVVPLGLVVAAFGLRVSVRPGLSTRPP
nr:hypothetical protein [Acidimicrobiia bacterium]